MITASQAAFFLFLERTLLAILDNAQDSSQLRAHFPCIGGIINRSEHFKKVAQQEKLPSLHDGANHLASFLRKSRLIK